MQQINMIQRVRHFGVSLLLVVCIAGALQAAWTYSDNFGTNKAEGDSHFHSMFWAMEATPLPEPYLFYMETGGGRGLVFMDYDGRPAELAYRLPLTSAFAGQAVEGTLRLDVSFPCNELVAQYPQGRLTYSVSCDGTAWSSPQPLGAGRHNIPLASPLGTCYILFSGTRAMIENLQVSLDSPGVTLRVPKDFATIQDAIDAARHGNVIEVEAGTYSGPGNWDIEFRGKRITVRSASGPERTIIDCSKGTLGGASHRGFYFHEREGADSVLSGFTIRGGRVFGSEIPPDPLHWDDDPSHPIGGGIYCEFSSPTIADCIIEDCGAELGGGIGCVGGSPVILGCVIEQCSAGGFGPAESGGRGGGIGLVGASDVTISACTIQDNSGYYNSFGAGIYCEQSSAVVSGGTISDNTAPGNLQGGGAYCVGKETDITFRNCIIAANEAETGAGIFTESSTFFYPRCRVTVINCTLADNRFTGPSYLWGSGSALYSAGTDILVTNSIIWDNSGTPVLIDKPVSTDPVTYSDVELGYAGTGNINKDPLFKFPPYPYYSLQSSFGRYDPVYNRWVYDPLHSPCIDAGAPEASVAAEPLPAGGRINMGAYGGTTQASKGAEHSVYHVDGTSGRDWNNGLTQSRAFATIQKAIDKAQSGDTVLVWPGVYAEPITVMGKAITIRSAADAAVIMAPGDIGVSFYYAESSHSVLANFVITGCTGGAIFCDGTSPTLKNLTIVGNGFGVTAYEGGEPDIVNCILWSNRDGDIFRDGYSSQWQGLARYSCIEQGAPNPWAGNISVNPLFADPQNGDYHLQSRYGRYVPADDAWVTDNVSSMCIDAGDPDEDFRAEHTPNGARINMGAYGGTASASLSSWPQCN